MVPTIKSDMMQILIQKPLFATQMQELLTHSQDFLPPDMISISQNGQTIPIAVENGKPDTSANCFYMKSKDRHIKIAVSDKFWVKEEDFGIVFMTEYSELMGTLNLHSFLSQVKHPPLLRTHKSYVVNTCKLTSFDSRAVYINYKGQEKVLAIGQPSAMNLKIK